MRKHEFLYGIFKRPRVLNPIFYIDGLNKLYIIFFFVMLWSIGIKTNAFSIGLHASVFRLMRYSTEGNHVTIDVCSHYEGSHFDFLQAEQRFWPFYEVEEHFQEDRMTSSVAKQY